MAGKYCTHCGSSDIIIADQDEWQAPNCPAFECLRCHAVFIKPELCAEADNTLTMPQKPSLAKPQPPYITAALLTLAGILTIGVFSYLSFTDTSFVRFLWSLNLDKWVNISFKLFFVATCAMVVYFIIHAKITEYQCKKIDNMLKEMVEQENEMAKHEK